VNIVNIVNVADPEICREAATNDIHGIPDIHDIHVIYGLHGFSCGCR
jgi:hypothetical protein